MDLRSGAASAQATAKHTSENTSIGRLIRLFWLWKALLLTIAAASPGPGYDTSTQILFDRYRSSSTTWLAEGAEWLAAKLTRWDAIYFTNTAARGLLFEQEWAFSPVFSRITSIIARTFPSDLCGSRIVCNAWAGVLISHVSHLGAVLVLFALTYHLIPAGDARRRQIAFTTACLHIISPGGLFLSAFYGESAFALLNFSGMLLFATVDPSQLDRRNSFYAATDTVASGIAFGLASMVRSNGLFSGSILACDAVAYLPSLPRILQQRQWNHLKRLTGLLLGGVVMLIFQLLLQGQAYMEYCTDGNSRPWCNWLPPSIYTWVQQHYWGVGFLRYWTLSNLPLFALAAPMVIILLGSAIIALNRTLLSAMVQDVVASDNKPAKDSSATVEVRRRFESVMARFALPQLILVVLAFTSFHVQIINRISSGYPVWYIVLALAIHADKSSTAAQKYGFFLSWLSRNSTWIVRAMAMYAIVQGGLYASFMPPA